MVPIVGFSLTCIIECTSAHHPLLRFESDAGERQQWGQHQTLGPVENSQLVRELSERSIWPESTCSSMTPRIHRKEEARSKKEQTQREFSPGRSIFVTERGNPFATFGGIVDEVTNAGRAIALIDIFGRLTPVEFEPRQLTPAA
ncbi:transcription termination/antitermination protein NusG [Phyllobacterium zundukense]|uniref:KOW domain-containing protein n=1 Tax=Phyllobacterium zundukense TaxID=1867719 RepID=A0A2N9VW33_9HYPH|nr:hypothetical protein [Phyllobacterium zundukense]ATU91434.1 hypothetical protein BLM14_07160 [Phyllobacterium zundukense]PIO43701.1 hypothetical protein B5P45_17545 [Phyllobacterium zundukense]